MVTSVVVTTSAAVAEVVTSAAVAEVVTSAEVAAVVTAAVVSPVALVTSESFTCGHIGVKMPVWPACRSCVECRRPQHLPV